jgi:hypothetical protein
MTSSNASLPISSLGAPVVDPDAVYVWIGIIGIILLVIVIVAVVVICSVRRCRQKSEVQQKPAAEMASTSGRELPHNYDRLPSALDANSGVVHGEYAEMTSARDGANASPSQPKIGTDYVTFWNDFVMNEISNHTRNSCFFLLQTVSSSSATHACTLARLNPNWMHILTIIYCSMVLESFASRILERILGEFVEGFTPGNVNLSLFTKQSTIGT